MLELKELTKNYANNTVINKANATFNNGINVIIGLNGSGKSTLLKLMCGFIKANKGSIILNGVDISNLEAEDRYIGYVPQHTCLFPNLTVEENINYTLKNRRGSKVAIKDAMALLELTPYASFYPQQLSGGFQSRVALARSLASLPQALFLDEALSDVDQAIKEKLIPRFREILCELKIPVLYVTHDLNEAALLGNKFYVISKGILKYANSAELAFENIRNELFNIDQAKNL